MLAHGGFFLPSRNTSRTKRPKSDNPRLAYHRSVSVASFPLPGRTRDRVSPFSVSIKKVRLQGLEPWTYGLKDSGQTASNPEKTGDEPEPLHGLYMADPDLKLVAERWEQLPPEIRAAIIAIVRTARLEKTDEIP